MCFQAHLFAPVSATFPFHRECARHHIQISHDIRTFVGNPNTITQNCCMDPHAIETLGYMGAAIINVSALPQIYKCYVTRSAKDFSWGFFSTLGVGMMLNFAYGIMIEHPAIYCGSSVSFVLYGSIAGMKYWFERPVHDTVNDEIRLTDGSLSEMSDLRTKI